VRERVVADVVQESGDAREHAFIAAEGAEIVVLLEQRKRAPSEVVGSQRMLEPRMRRAGIDEKRETKLPDVEQPLKRRRIDQLEAQRIDADVVPERVSDISTDMRQ